MSLWVKDGQAHFRFSLKGNAQHIDFELEFNFHIFPISRQGADLQVGDAEHQFVFVQIQKCGACG
jgi:hypothetical protein